MLWYNTIMKYQIIDDKIIIEKHEDFNIKQILESGQIFRFGCADDVWWCASGDKFAKLYEQGDACVIETLDPEYFVNFFDLKTEYFAIKTELAKDKFMAEVISKCPGIRILKREKLDTIIEFIISANNNISRIKKIVEKLCALAGEKKEWGYAFPTKEVLLKLSIEDFNSLGAGYRGNYLYQAVQQLKNVDIEALGLMPTTKLKNYLIGLSGIGPKVANCILLFGFSRVECFPVDTWIEKVYREHFHGKLQSRDKITKYFEAKFGKKSGIAQQYLFYAKRENIIK